MNFTSWIDNDYFQRYILLTICFNYIYIYIYIGVPQIAPAYIFKIAAEQHAAQVKNPRTWIFRFRLGFWVIILKIKNILGI